MIINLTGQAGSGKTSIAKEITNILPKSINIDGDELREIFVNKDYSEAGRRKNIQNAYNIALFLEAKGFTPVISLISPYKDLRDELKSNAKGVLEVYVTTTEIRGKEKFFAEGYEKPTEKFLPIDTTGGNASVFADQIITCLNNGLFKHLIQK
jgi:adenylylsulfate kinase